MIADKLTTIAENEQRVYDSGIEKGFGQGKKSEYDRFWDAYQQNGTRTNYENAFAGFGWNETTFMPKHPITASTSTYMMFRYCAFNGDLAAHLQNLNCSLSTTGCANFQYAFYGSRFTRIGEVDLQNALYLQSAFGACTLLETIDKIVSAENTAYDASTFAGCKALKNVTIEGTIGRSLSMRDCENLSLDSILSIINALSSTTSGLTLTLNGNAVMTALNIGEWPDGTAEWLAITEDKQNWSYVFT